MRIVKIILTGLAVLVAAVASIATIPSEVVELLLATAGVLSANGYTVPRIPPQLARLCWAFAIAAPLAIAAHAAGKIGGPALLYKVLGYAGVLVGAIGRLAPREAAQPSPVPRG